MKCEITGKVVRINPTKTFKSGYKSRSFWVEEKSEGKDGQEFVNTLEFEVGSKADSKFDNTAELDQFGPGTIVKFSYAPRGTIWKGSAEKPVDPPRCFVSLRVISKIEVVGGAAKPAPSCPPPATPHEKMTYEEFEAAEEMPF